MDIQQDTVFNAIESMSWLIKSIDFTNNQTGIHNEDSPELSKAKDDFKQLAEEFTGQKIT